MLDKKPITSFRDLDVYQTTYKNMLIVMKSVIPLLPISEKYDLVDQLSRSCKAIPRLIAEGYAKRHQKMGFQKYLDDALAETNETIVSLEQCRDIYQLEEVMIKPLVTTYDIAAKQIYRLRAVWTTFQRPSS